LIPALVRDKNLYAEPYAPLEPAAVEATGLPPPPALDAYLEARLRRFDAELREWRPGKVRVCAQRERVCFCC
jgi:hypothetical protein